MRLQSWKYNWRREMKKNEERGTSVIVQEYEYQAVILTGNVEMRILEARKGYWLVENLHGTINGDEYN